MTFQGDKLSTLYLDMTLVAGFFTSATLWFLSLYFKNIKGPIFGNAHLEALERFIKTS